MRRFFADLHIHTILSPCAEEEMVPAGILVEAAEKQLDIIAICDHNSAGNTRAVMELAERFQGDLNLLVIPGIEIASEEEVHVVGLFPSVDRAEAVGRIVLDTLPEQGPASKLYGDQVLVDAEGERLGGEPRMLSMASTFSLEEVVALIRQHEGLVVASHVDRPSFSVMSQLGFFPEDVVFDAVEISASGVANGRVGEFESLGVPLVSSSDSHFLSEIGITRTYFDIEGATFEEVRRAFRREAGRDCGIA